MTRPRCWPKPVAKAEHVRAGARGRRPQSGKRMGVAPGALTFTGHYAPMANPSSIVFADLGGAG